MSRKIAVKLIMELRANGLSQSSITRSRHMSKTSVNEVFRISEEQHLSYDDIKDRPSGEVYHLFFPYKCFLQGEIPHFCKRFSPGTGGEFLGQSNE